MTKMLETLDPAGSRFADAVNRHAFLFEHMVHRLDLFELDRLAALARRLGPQNAYWSTRPIGIGDGWGDLDGHDAALDQAVLDIAGSNSLVMLKGIEADPEYGAVFRGVVAEYARLGGLHGDMAHGRATLLISSPRRITGYHIDAEVNFLLQLRGEKTVYVFDGSDPAVLPPPELEAFFAGNMNAAIFRPAQQDNAWAVAFRPGLGVHMPVAWPHWVQNGTDVSVSISINYDLRSVARQARMHRANAKLRKLGLSPVRPGAGWLDGGKAAIIAGIDRIKARV